MTKEEKIKKILRALLEKKAVYIHGLGSTGNGMRIQPNGHIYIGKYVNYSSTYWGWIDITQKEIDDLDIDWRRRIEIIN